MREIRVDLETYWQMPGVAQKQQQSIWLQPKGRLQRNRLSISIAALQFLVSGHVDEGIRNLQPVLKAVGMKLATSPLRALLSPYSVARCCGSEV